MGRSRACLGTNERRAGLRAFFAIDNSAPLSILTVGVMREQMTEFPSINAKNDHSPLRFTSQGPLGTVFLSYPRGPSEMMGFFSFGVACHFLPVCVSVQECDPHSC